MKNSLINSILFLFVMAITVPCVYAMQETKVRAASIQELNGQDFNGDVEMAEAQTLPAQRDSKEAKAEHQEAQNPNRVKIHLPGKDQEPEFFDLMQEDIIHVMSFNELIMRQKQHGDTFILARVEIIDEKENTKIDYGCAHDTLFTVLKQGYPYSNLTSNQRDMKDNQGNRLLDHSRRYIRDITFYMYDADKPALGFEFLCTYRDLFSTAENKKSLLYLFGANQNNWQDPNQKTVKYNQMHLLADCYFDGNGGVQQNYQEVIKLYKRLAEQNVDFPLRLAAIDYLINIYLNGPENIKDPMLASRYLIDRVIKTHDKSKQAILLNQIGSIFLRGADNIKDYGKAHDWYSLAAEQTDHQGAPQLTALLNLGHIHLKGPDPMQNYAKARSIFTRVALAVGSFHQANAFNRLGDIYFNGHGVTKDFVQARDWYIRAAEQTNNLQDQAVAFNSLGNLYLNGGHGVTKDFVQARDWYIRAAEQTNNLKEQAIAFNRLGDIYFNGHGVTRDCAQACQWYERAVGQPHSLAERIFGCGRLGQIYHKGLGVTKNNSEAVKYFTVIVQHCDSDSLVIKKTAIEWLAEIKAEAAAHQENGAADISIEPVAGNHSSSSSSAQSKNQGTKRKRDDNDAPAAEDQPAVKEPRIASDASQTKE